VAKVDYGIDAPGVIRNLAICGAALVIVRAFTATISIGPLKIINFQWTGYSCLATAGLMLLYSKVGKMRHRDRMIGKAALKGNEQVLDVGTGRGLLLIAAAKKLSKDKGGHAVGIDIWKASDLSENLRERTQQNLEIEGVVDRCELIDAPAEKMLFSEGSFDVIVSNMCLHNIPKADERRAACLEIVRVLKPGGIAVISDYKNTKTYARIFKDAGLAVSRKFYFADTFFPVSIVLAKKSA
jgi:arsenite methyltransferase